MSAVPYGQMVSVIVPLLFINALNVATVIMVTHLNGKTSRHGAETQEAMAMDPNRSNIRSLFPNPQGVLSKDIKAAISGIPSPVLTAGAEMLREIIHGQVLDLHNHVVSLSLEDMAGLIYQTMVITQEFLDAGVLNAND